MSVLIKGMKIPQNCCECPLIYYEDASCLFTGIVALSIGRQAACPLVSVPPHGRLIDTDVLVDMCKRMENDDWNMRTTTSWSVAFETFRELLEDAPTIIEAEEGE